MQENTTKRVWLLRTTLLIIGMFIITFFVIYLRGAVWSPAIQNYQSVQVDLGATQLVREQGQRLWVTRLTDQQRQQLKSIDSWVFTDAGCARMVDYCWVQPTTSQQGVILRYVIAKPDILATEALWIGGFINPVNGAVYDLLGRLYRNSTRSLQAAKSVNIDL